MPILKKVSSEFFLSQQLMRIQETNEAVIILNETYTIDNSFYSDDTFAFDDTFVFDDTLFPDNFFQYDLSIFEFDDCPTLFAEENENLRQNYESLLPGKSFKREHSYRLNYLMNISNIRSFIFTFNIVYSINSLLFAEQVLISSMIQNKKYIIIHENQSLYLFEYPE